MHLSASAKAVTTFVTGAMTWGGVVVASNAGHVTSSEWLGAAGVVAATVLTWFVPNTPAIDSKQKAIPAPQMVDKSGVNG